MRRWLLAAGGTWSTECSIGFAGGVENGLFAAADFREGELLLSVPAHLLLTAGIADTRGWPDELPEEDKIALLLLVECDGRGSESKWHPWTIDGVPALFDLPMTWEDADARELRCPSLIESVSAQRDAIAARYDDVVAAVRNLSTTHALHRLLIGESEHHRRSAWRRYLWAVSALQSRGVHLNDESLHAEEWALVPVGDLFNHASADRANAIAQYDVTKQAYCYHATRAVGKGEELFLCYGPRDDSTLLQSYGFVLPGNPHARVLVQPPQCSADAAEAAGDTDAGECDSGCVLLTEADLEWLAEHGLDAEHAFDVGGPSWTLLAALRLKHASPSERAAGAAFAIVEGEPVSARAELEAWQEARRMIRKRLDGSHSDLEELRAELKQAEAAEAAEAAEKGVAGASAAVAAAAAANGTGGETVRSRRRLLTVRWLVAQGSLLQRALEATKTRLADLHAEATARDGVSGQGDTGRSGGGASSGAGSSSDGDRRKRARRSG